VAIIDAADDLNLNAANALLKTLEEPPPKGVLLMVCHSPGRLLATIRSRCRRLAFSPLSLEAAAKFIGARAEVTPQDALRLAAMAQGAPGRTLALMAAQALTLDEAAGAILADLPRLDEGLALSLADRFRGGEGAVQFNLLFERLADRVHAQAIERAGQGARPIDRWAHAWETLQRLPQEVEALNLDRTDALFSALNELRQAAART
jgi:DNA polymerase-3 subunit delta'